MEGANRQWSSVSYDVLSLLARLGVGAGFVVAGVRGLLAWPVIPTVSGGLWPVVAVGFIVGGVALGVGAATRVTGTVLALWVVGLGLLTPQVVPLSHASPESWLTLGIVCVLLGRHAGALTVDNMVFHHGEHSPNGIRGPCDPRLGSPKRPENAPPLPYAEGRYVFGGTPVSQ